MVEFVSSNQSDGPSQSMYSSWSSLKQEMCFLISVEWKFVYFFFFFLIIFLIKVLLLNLSFKQKCSFILFKPSKSFLYKLSFGNGIQSLYSWFTIKITFWRFLKLEEIFLSLFNAGVPGKKLKVIETDCLMPSYKSIDSLWS